MLAMPSDWSRYPTTAVVARLYEQIPHPSLRRGFAKHIIGATLKLSYGKLHGTSRAFRGRDKHRDIVALW